jgi:hypothetical protein
MGADPPAIAGFGGAALSAGLHGGGLGCGCGVHGLVLDLRHQGPSSASSPRQKSCHRKSEENSEAEERKAYAETARSAQTTFRNGSKENDTSRDDQYLPNGCRSEN